MPDQNHDPRALGIASGSADEPLGVALRRKFGQIVLVLQGGGALGAYQVGVYEALREAGIEPDWVIGTSIGAINASLIAGNHVAHRLERMLEFWHRIEHDDVRHLAGMIPGIGAFATQWLTMATGVKGFFAPNPLAFAGARIPLGAEAGYYRTTPLRETLNDLVDFPLIQQGGCRLTVGAANLNTSEMTYFDSARTVLCADHVMASGALPPAFPAVRIGSDLYWDGGILSNTPVEAVFDDFPRRNSLVFAVHVWNPNGPEPSTLADVIHRQKEVQYSSRASSHVMRQKQLHRLRHVIAELARYLPDDLRQDARVRDLASHGCLTQMHVVRLLAPRIDGETHAKDIDFSRDGISQRRHAGYQHAKGIVGLAPWDQPASADIEGVILHETDSPRTAVTF